jgi:hypothetical protein
VNALFITFFNYWVKTDTVAKRFLTELNGFDFLLDRLFSKVEEDDKEETVVNLQEALLSEEGP